MLGITYPTTKRHISEELTINPTFPQQFL